MINIDDLNIALMCGNDIPIVDCQLVAHQPSIQELALLGERSIFMAAQTLNVHKKLVKAEDISLLGEITNFEVFMMVMNDERTQDKKEEVMELLQLVFPEYKISLLPRSLGFFKEGLKSPIMVDENNFESLQYVLSQIFCQNSQSNQGFNPVDKKAQEIADKLMRGRARVAAQKEAGEAGDSIFTKYISILSIGLHKTPEEIKEMTMYQLFDLVERYSLYINWDIDLRVRLAGGTPNEQADDWMKNIH